MTRAATALVLLLFAGGVGPSLAKGRGPVKPFGIGDDTV